MKNNHHLFQVFTIKSNIIINYKQVKILFQLKNL